MQRTQKKWGCLLLAGILLLSCFAGCAPKAEENLETGIVSGTVSPDSIAIVRGENKLTICQAPDGTFHMVWTSSWTDRIIGYASSPDLIHWSEQRSIPVMMQGGYSG